MIYLITFLLSFIMLITEILFTRLFSVVFWYHFTFLVVSLSLLGLSAGGVYVYLYSDKKFLKGRIYPQLILSTAYLAIALFICLLTFCHFPFSLNFSFYGFLRTFFVCIITAVPFFIFGICFSLIFLHFSAYINKIYFANLIGSASGCLLAVPVIYIFGVPDAIIAICCLLTLISFVLCWHYERSESAVKRPNILLGGFLLIFSIVILGIYFSLYGKGVFLNIAKGFYAIRRYEGAYGMLQPFSFYKDFLNGWFDKITYKTLRLFIVLLIINISFLYIFFAVLKKGITIRKAILTITSFLTLSFLSFAVFNISNDIIDARFSKGRAIIYSLKGRWNHLSKTFVHPGNTLYPKEHKRQNATALSSKYKGPVVDTLGINLDGKLGTPVIRYDGDIKKVEFLKYDLPSLGFNLKGKDADVLIIGAGGGKDVLTSIIYGAKEIDAVEINPDVVKFIKEDFAEFSGNLYNLANVNAIVMEGRNFVSQTRKKYDIIQLSVVDSFNPTAAGAYALSENYLYTEEAFKNYIEALKPDGIVIICYLSFEPPRLSLRLASLFISTARKLGIENPGDHLVAVKNMDKANLIFKKSPFTGREVRIIEKRAKKLNFKTLYSPGHYEDERFYKVATLKDPSPYYKSYIFDITSPTDDKPFFYQIAKFKNLFSNLRYRHMFYNIVFFEANFILFLLLISVTILVILLIFLPLLMSKLKGAGGHNKKYVKIFSYFACLGLGFMLIEISLMQKYVLFLGHPTYSFSFLLCCILLCAGLGSLYANRFSAKSRRISLRRILFLLILLAAFYISFERTLLSIFLKKPLLVKAILSFIFVAPFTFLMGMPFPTGIKIIDKKYHNIIPWIWGVNGASSVLGSILALFIAIAVGLKITFFTGIICYAIALMLILKIE